MEMAKFSLSFHLLWFILVLASVKTLVPSAMVAACTQAVIGGGCPDVKKCVEVCRPCYRGIGQISVFCRPAGGGIPVDQCVCSFKSGAPCNPPSPPRCPGKWPPADEISANGTIAKTL